MKYIEYGNIKEYQNEIKNFYSNINNDKKIIIDKLTYLKNKNQSILGEYLLKKILENKLKINYNSIKYNYNEYNKPFIKNNNIYFNISHSDNYAICIVSDHECGIDIEKIKEIKPSVIKFFCTKKEQEYVLSKNTDKNKRALEIFCLKEAYNKMKGTGLKNPKEIEFIIKDKKIICSDKTVDCFLNYNISSYIVATCIKKDN